MAAKTSVVVLVAAMQFLMGSCLSSLSRQGTSSTANPIRRVVTLLQTMQSKVTAEGKEEEDLFDKFMCYCKTGDGDLSASISSAEGKITQDTSSLQEAEALSTQLKQELAEHTSDRADAKDAVAKAKALRANEASVFAKDSGDAKTNIAALSAATAALEKGVGGSFLQTSAAARLRQLTIDMDLSAADRDIMAAFLSEGQGYAPQSGEIIGILKQMKDTMEKDLADMTATEESAIKDFNALVAAKEKEIGANTKAIESKTERSGQTGLEIVNLKEDLDDTTKGLYADRKFLADLDNSCATKKAEWEERSKTRAEELLALADTIKLLNDDDALELFKKTLPSPSLLQIKRTGAVVRQHAMQLLKGAREQKDPRMDLVMLALAGRGKSFDEVLKMIDEMVALLGKEQADDNGKKAYCEKELDSTEDHKKEIDQTLIDLNKAIAHAEENIARLAEEIVALASGIKALDKSVADATEQRKAENAEYKSTMAADQAAKELIGVAKNRLMKFYNPALHKAAPKVELSEQQRIAVNMGSEAAPTVAPSGIAGTGITYIQEPAPTFVQVGLHGGDTSGVAPAPPPETWGAYQTKGQEKNGVVEMMNLLVADLDKEMTQMEVDEKDAQAEYETFMDNSRAKRASDSQSMADKEGVKAELESGLQTAGEEKKATLKEGMATAESIKDLHQTCDWLLANFEVRKAARSGEVDSLKNAKAVLSGADYSFAQQSVRVLRSRNA